MRTTLSIDPDVLHVAKSMARAEGKSVGTVVSELLRRALEPRPMQGSEEGFPIFEVSPDAAPITLETVHRGLEDEE